MDYKSTDCSDEPYLCEVQEYNKDRTSLCMATEAGGAYYTYGEDTS